ncbi:MAG: hypothetical protein EON85_02510 [Brevundimonas sp.]|nr:MAG: hypothetical protein EON85_02510 [Brevundimonas sp.]
MTGGRRLLIVLGGAVLFMGALAGGVVLSGRSLVIIDNRGQAPLTLEIETTHPGDFSWTGDVDAGERLFRVVRFSADGGVRAVCRDADGVHRTTGGFVTSGWPHRVDVIASGCATMRIEAERLP